MNLPYDTSGRPTPGPVQRDDQWFPEHLQRQTALLKRNPQLIWATANFVMCFCGENHRRQKLDERKAIAFLHGREFFDNYFEAFVRGATGWTGTMVIKREALEQAGLFRLGQLTANDVDMWWRIAYRWPAIGYTPQASAVYHCHVRNSITRKHRDPRHLTDLLTRHLKLAQEHDKLALFLPCARHMLRFYIHKYFFDDRINRIRELIVTFDGILPSFYKSTVRLLTVWPQATTACMPFLRWINKRSHLPL